jgi:hypothetical protein
MTPEEAYEKCNGKINKDLEPYLIKDPYYAYYYASIVIKDRWPEAEPYVMKDPYCAYHYSLDIIKGRWIEAESIISTSSYYAYLYALSIINGKLPENMHNMMLLHADHYAKLYFKFIKNKPQP